MRDRPPTSHDVARAAGVSQPTVSRALRGDPRVTQATRDRIAQAARELGYVASHRGRSLSTRRTDRIGVVVEDLDNPFYLELLDELHDQLERADVRMIVFTPRHDDPEGLARLVDGSIDGVVLTTTFLDSPLPGLLRDRGSPFVLLNRIVDEPGVATCSVDNASGGRLIAEAILAEGHPRHRRRVRPGGDEHGPRPRARGARGPRGGGRRAARRAHASRVLHVRGRPRRGARAARRRRPADGGLLRQRRHRARRAQRLPSPRAARARPTSASSASTTSGWPAGTSTG